MQKDKKQIRLVKRYTMYELTKGESTLHLNFPTCRSLSKVGVVFLTSALVQGVVFGQNPTDTPTVKPLPISTGVVPLPSGSPGSKTLMPLPHPAVRLRSASMPMLQSPSIEQLDKALASHPLTMEQAVAVALAVNPQLESSVANLLTLQGRTSEAATALNPGVSLNSSLTEYDAPSSVNLGGKTVTFLNQFNPIVIATASVPIDITGILRDSVSQAQFEQAAARIDVEQVRSQVVYNVQEAFYNVLDSQAQYAVASGALKSNLSQLDIAQKNYAAGTSPRYDVLVSQTNAAAAEDAFLQAQQSVSEAFIKLKQAIGININAPISISDSGAVRTPPGVEPPTPLPPPVGPPPGAAPQVFSGPSPEQQIQQSLPSADHVAMPNSAGGNVVSDPLDLGPEIDGLIAQAQKQRPEILAAEAQLAAARKGVQIASGSMLPRISFGLSYTLNPNPGLGTRYNQAAATLNFAIPIYDGGLAKARITEAHGAVAQAEEAKREAEDAVNAQVRDAYINLIQARDRVAVSNQALVQAQEAFRLAQVRYQAGVTQSTGVSPIVELSNSQTSLTQAQSNQVSALYAYNIARANLDLALGRNAVPEAKK